MTRKGAGYSLEAVVAIGTVVIFVLGGLTIPDNQNWNQFRTKVSTQDLTYALQDSGYVNHALSEGEVGSIQTAISVVSEVDSEVSGVVSNLPISENAVAFYTLPEDRFTQGIEEVESGDECYGDLGEISSRSEEPVMRTDGTNLESKHGETLYLGDLDPNQVGGNDKTDYDSIWVDNGTKCQFSSAEGPHYIDNIVNWGDEHYDVKDVDSSDSEMKLYKASQIVRLRNTMQKDVNGVETFITVDAINFTELNPEEYNVFVVRQKKALDYIDSGNQSAVTSFMESRSMLVLAKPNSTHFETGDFLKRAGFNHYPVSYSGSYSGGPIDGRFSQTTASQNTETYFLGLKGRQTQITLPPSGVTSGRENTIQSSESILMSRDETFNFSTWSRENTSLTPNTSSIAAAPESECYFDSSGDPRPEALTTGKITFPDGGTRRLISAELGTSESFCQNNNERGIVLDTDNDNILTDEKVLLEDQIIVAANRVYIIKTGHESGCNEGECVRFEFAGNSDVEIISNRQSFPDFNGQRMAITGYEASYNSDDRRAITSVIHWLRGNQLGFTGLSPPDDITTKTYSGIKGETYMPYELTLRWSR